MRETVKLALRLMIFALVAALLLAVVNDLTHEQIAKNVASKINAARAAVIGDFEFTDAQPDLEGYDMIKGVYAASDGGTPAGYVYELENKGYGGIISISVGVNPDGTLSGVMVSNHSETKGLGSNAEAAFLAAFIGKKSGADSALSVDAMSGATISSNAIRGAVDTAMSHYKDNYLDGEASAE